MSCLWSPILSNRVWGSWYLIIWLEISVQSSTIDFWTGFFKLTLGSDCLEPFFGPVAFKIILTQWYCRNTNSLNMLSLNLTPKFSFTSRFRMFIINVYYTKKETLVVLLLTLRDSNWLILNCTLQSYKLITLLLSGYNLRKHMPYLDRSM